MSNDVKKQQSDRERATAYWSCLNVSLSCRSKPSHGHHVGFSSCCVYGFSGLLGVSSDQQKIPTLALRKKTCSSIKTTPYFS
jgi:hypothetical protein